MTNPKITIITATYNLIVAGRKDFFIKALESVAMQDYENFEHIVIDGASTDGTVELLEEYKNKGYISCYSEKDTGIYNAFNKGIKRASGKYIAFLGSDDFYTRNDTFSLVAKKLEDEQSDFSYAPYDFIQENVTSQNQPSFAHFPFEMPFGHPTMFTKKSVFEDLNYFDENYRIAADFDFILRAILKGYQPSRIEQSFIAFRKGGISSTQIELCSQETKEIARKNSRLNEKEFQKYYGAKYLPKNLLTELLGSLSPKVNKEEIFKGHTKRYAKYLKRQLFTLRWSKRRKIIRLFGITFYNKELY